ncbi:MAG: A/G-specific adenine glycosylase [Candidatus Kapabacteria bacterium]|nr:A/G-specific adenine glycosylase [Candidatus Kapabacteria bacterium]
MECWRESSPNLRMEITQRLLEWYDVTARRFPWRSDDVDPYMVLVSETMLQQTQASRVAALLPPFMEAFPHVHALAKASNADIIRHWKGLGYNSRALRLRDAARAIVEHHGGIIPQSPELLRALPGVGPYTSAAIACFAFDVWTVVLDVNVRRVYSRWSQRQLTTVDVLPDKELTTYATALIPRDVPSKWHHAVMDLGATICTARDPKCSACPLSECCASAGTLQPASVARRAEPSFRGEPRRLWRGRVVDHLRSVGAGGVSEAALAVTILGDVHSADERQWLSELLAALETDGLVSRKGRRVSLAD